MLEWKPTVFSVDITDYRLSAEKLYCSFTVMLVFDALVSNIVVTHTCGHKLITYCPRVLLR